MSEVRTHCSCGRKIADNFELRATVMSLEKNWGNASSACNRVAGERDRFRAALQRIATFYDGGESDFSDDTPTSIAKEALEI